MKTTLETISFARLAVVLGGQGTPRAAKPEELAQDKVKGNAPLTCWDQASGGAVCVGQQKVNVYTPDGTLGAQWDHRYLDTKL
jgi:hypothetical protein